MLPVLVVCALIEREGKILLGRRAPGRSLAGKWELPGGKQERGESPELALQRELREELGWETEPQYAVSAVVTSDMGCHIRLEAWYTLAPKTLPTAQVHDAFVWVDPRELFENTPAHGSQPLLEELAPADIPLIKAWLAQSSSR
ncbi:MAG: NUDIX domain-containing protein [Spirochaetales bacterium]|nr:NUDIX domain-containing protein [Spirochaetales bacterium]